MKTAGTFLYRVLVLILLLAAVGHLESIATYLKFQTLMMLEASGVEPAPAPSSQSTVARR
jgi:hypothetical protein